MHSSNKRMVDADAAVSSSKSQKNDDTDATTAYDTDLPPHLDSSFMKQEVKYHSAVAYLCKIHLVLSPERHLEHLWETLYAQSKAESGTMYGKRWDTAGRRQTVQVCDDRALLYHYNGAASAPAVINFADNSVIRNLHRYVCAAFSSRHPPNFCLVNFYTADGTLGWHSDDESDLEPDANIISLSYSTHPRHFEFRVKTDHKHKWRLELESGSALVMNGACQQLLQHCVPKQALPADFRRVNLTFRTIKKRA
jgi:alkylated DNA repair dioxygenase AlkB